MESWIPFIPEAASTFARHVDAVYFYITGVTIFFTVLLYVTILFFAIRYRQRTKFEVPRPIAGSLKLETMWTVVPFLISMTMFAWATSVFFMQYRMPKQAMEVYVVGKQWMWKVQHPTGQREINELHIPVGRRVKLIMTSEDVIHSFFIPAFRTKSDVVPGRYTELWFEATKPGRYHLFCAEYCGMNHSGMGGWVEVMDAKDFDNWLSGNANQQSPSAAGQQLFANTLGCASCHGEKGEGGRGPSLINLFGSQQPLTNGQTAKADESYLRESILNPQSQIVAGYQPIMPTYAGQVSEEQLLQLISYIKSLSPAKTEGISANAPASENNRRTGPATQAGQGAKDSESQRMNPLNSTAPSGKANTSTPQQ
ncbi:MAG TPA: cytochrome c oxidase subunit II [Pyrinomonadaceae bacterium]|jgi:cytochrome c oxidase subunit 2